MPWSLLLKVTVLKLKYEFRMVYRSSSLWPGIKQFYSTILDYTSWTVGTGSFINLWNDKCVRVKQCLSSRREG